MICDETRIWLQLFPSGTRRGTVAAEDAKRQETRHCDVVPDRQTVRNWWWLRRCLEVSSSSSCTKNETIGFPISTFDYKVVIPCILSCLRCWPGLVCQLTLVVSVSVRPPYVYVSSGDWNLQRGVGGLFSIPKIYLYLYICQKLSCHIFITLIKTNWQWRIHHCLFIYLTGPCPYYSD